MRFALLGRRRKGWISCNPGFLHVGLVCTALCFSASWWCSALWAGPISHQSARMSADEREVLSVSQQPATASENRSKQGQSASQPGGDSATARSYQSVKCDNPHAHYTTRTLKNRTQNSRPREKQYGGISNKVQPQMSISFYNTASGVPPREAPFRAIDLGEVALRPHPT